MTDRPVEPPPPQSSGPSIPAGVRGAILNRFTDEGVSDTEIWEAIKEAEGWDQLSDVSDDISQRFGSSEALTFDRCIQGVDLTGIPLVVGNDDYAKPALLGLPDSRFLLAIREAIFLLARPSECGLGTGGIASRADIAIEVVNRLFTNRGIWYRFTPDGQAVWYGDEHMHQTVIQPTLAALSDSRLAGCRSEYVRSVRVYADSAAR